MTDMERARRLFGDDLTASGDRDPRDIIEAAHAILSTNTPKPTPRTVRLALAILHTALKEQTQ